MIHLKQPKINTSFPKKDQHIYHEIIKESTLTNVPVATLMRNYVKKGMGEKQGTLVGAY